MASLASIAPELRNNIAMLLLQHDGIIMVTPLLREPAFLSVNSTIRSEYRSMWYQINTFRITVSDCNATLLEAFTKQIVRFDFHANIKFQMHVDGRSSWQNLMRWVGSKYASYSWATYESGGGDAELHDAISAVLEFGEVNEETPWLTRELGFNCIRRAIGSYQPGWLQ
ncbi:unnamed protein product [Zymoseptoria tritici ST99CH_1E4]|uniref:Uncharacterized protein n=1 Tax=Zymoseptoria tritici ST99CH_1E4 TaxID=1276532 RepID=A0A2H1FZQ5_ZYMTR|nr:unnamed protein product [Zymoseptoria tritici ST99CH_1E4]